MNCVKCRSEMSAYLDGELDAPLVRQMEAHLTCCPSCSRELAGLKASAHLVDDNMRELEPSAAIWRHVHKAISLLPEPSRRAGILGFLGGRGWIPMAATASAVFLLAIGIWSYIQKQESDQDLVRYMNSYLRMRDVQEQWHFMLDEDPAAPVLDDSLVQSASADNPFVVVKYRPNENPFRSEDQ